MEKYTFKFNNNTSKNTFHSTTTNYSKILDDIIATNIIDSNPYLKKFKYGDTIEDKLIDEITPKTKIIIGCPLKEENILYKATDFLSNKLLKKIIFGKKYKLTDGTTIIFYDDEIQIGNHTFNYSDFSNFSFIDSLEPTTKKIIINIYINNFAL